MKNINQDIAALFIDSANVSNDFFRTVERSGGGDLYRRERPIIEIGFNARQRGDKLFIADGKPHAPTGHGKGFRQRGELNGNIFRALHLQN